MVSLYNLLKQVGYLGLGVFQSIESGRFGDVSVLFQLEVVAFGSSLAVPIRV